MSTLSRKLVAACLVATISLVMYGCGGGGGGSSDPVDPPTTPAPTPTNVDLTGLSTATLKAGMHDIAAGGTATVGDITFMCAAGGDACKLTIAADLTATSLGGMVTADYSDAAKTRMAKAATDKANAISKAIAATDPTASGSNGVPTGATITRSTTGKTEVTMTLHADSTAKYAMSTSSSLPAISGWTAQSLSRTDDDAPMDSVGIYTDINNAKPMKLKYAADNAVLVPDANNLIVLDAKPSTSNYDEDDTIMGTIRGVHGTFTCGNTAGCTTPSVYGDAATGGVNPFTVNATMQNQGWSFVSTDNVESAAEQDADYLYFGYWIQTPSSSTGNYMFTTFSGGSNEYSGDFSSYTGSAETATYNGHAAGKYVKKKLAVVDGKLGTDSATSGVFTAAVSLDATFGTATSIPADDQNKISGTISKFMDGSQDLGFLLRVVGVIEGGATVSTTATGASVNAFHGTTPHDSAAWTGVFFGPHEVSDTDSTAVLPSGIAGTFSADFTDGNIAGGYGATR